VARPVLSKRDFVRRYAFGEFGNASPTWDTYWDWYSSKHWMTLVGQRYHVRNRVAGGQTWYDVEPRDMVRVWNEAVKKYSGSQLYISAMGPPDSTRKLQGEVQQGIWGLDLYYTTVKKPMRDALREKATMVQGLRAKMLLQRHLDQNSLEWLAHLLKAYRDHVVEFTAYDHCWGTVEGYNTLFWEVRKY